MSAVVGPAVSLGEGGSVAISSVVGIGGSVRVVLMDEVVTLVGKGGSVVVMDEHVDIVVVEGDSVGAIPE